jgi:hypothetical protein
VLILDGAGREELRSQVDGVLLAVPSERDGRVSAAVSSIEAWKRERGIG